MWLRRRSMNRQNVNGAASTQGAVLRKVQEQEFMRNINIPSTVHRSYNHSVTRGDGRNSQPRGCLPSRTCTGTVQLYYRPTGTETETESQSLYLLVSRVVPELIHAEYKHS
eukprot:COSAG05_NODE_187_length_14703_cov_123.022186_11_plen_111_part_00